METDEELAARLQTEYDSEAARFQAQSEKDLEYAKTLEASYHNISSDSEDEGNQTISKPLQNETRRQELEIVTDNGTKSISDVSEKERLGHKRKICKYGVSCYRKNPEHTQEYYHPSEGCSNTRSTDENSIISYSKKLKVSNFTSDNMSNLRSYSNKKFAERFVLSEPYHIFLNKCYSVKETQKDWLTLVFPDLLNKSFGTLIESAQLNFMVDLNFFMKFYQAAGLEETPILVMHGMLEGNPKDFPNVTTRRVDMPYQFGVHHSKMMLLQYKEGCRVVIHTANLIEDDWTEKTQGFWISDMFPLLEHGKPSLLEGESPTRFKHDLVDYLLSYKNKELDNWVQVLKSHDMSSCRAFFIGSVPGYHVGDAHAKYGHMKCRNIIRKYSSWQSGAKQPVIIQCSSIGSLGKDNQSWLFSELGVSLSGGNEASKSSVKLIYPCEEDVRNSSQGYGGGSCLPYNSKTHAKQKWLQQHLHCWRSEKRKRTPAMPHIKTYCRLSTDMKSVQYFMLTSANVSKAAWGQLQKQGSQLFIRAYEAGVLLMPKLIANEDCFQIENSDEILGMLNLPYDVPLTPYKTTDVPWFMDTPKAGPDNFNNSYK